MYRVHSAYKPTQTENVMSIASASEAWKVFFWRYVSIQLASMVDESNKSQGWLEYVKQSEDPALEDFVESLNIQA